MGVEGPITGGKGWAFGGPTTNLADYGYRQDEFFFDGMAARYGPVDGFELARDGKWHVEPVQTSRYRSRLVVIRPTDPAAFNGTVIVGWNNVSAGYENFGGGESQEMLEAGYAYVAVSAQRLGVHGTGENPQGLRTWDPDRYGTLSIPSDDYSFDIFTQAADLVAPDRRVEGIDLMGGLEVRQLFAQGASQSAARLATYFNAVQPLTGRFDAFFLIMYFGGGTPLEVGDEVMTVAAADTPGAPQIAEGLNLLRDDLTPRVMVVNTECEAMSCYPVRQPDTDRFRYWEVAGASHVSLPAIASSSPRMERDFGFAIPIDAGMDAINHVDIAPVVDAALHHLQSWLCDDIPPAAQALIEIGGDPATVARDADGLALGGVRLPQVEVPIAHNSAISQGSDVFSRLVGYHQAFTLEALRERYGTRAGYLARFEEAAQAAADAAVILPRDVDRLVAEATANIPL
jgi:hypothetical protein